MKKRSLGVLFVLVVVLVLSFAVVASASAAPYLTSCSPTSGSNSAWSSFQLKIFGQNLSDFYGDIDVALYQRNAPYDTIYATDPYVVSMFGGDYISCDINTYGESAGGYDVEVSGYYLLGQQWPTTLTLSNAFTVTGTSPVTAPTIASISPSTVAAGSAGFQMTVYGSNFGTGVGATSTVYWNNQALTTSPGSTSVLTALVPASYVANAGKATITVRTTTATFPATTTTSNSDVCRRHGSHPHADLREPDERLRQVLPAVSAHAGRHELPEHVAGAHQRRRARSHVHAAPRRSPSSSPPTTSPQRRCSTSRCVTAPISSPPIRWPSPSRPTPPRRPPPSRAPTPTGTTSPSCSRSP